MPDRCERRDARVSRLGALVLTIWLHVRERELLRVDALATSADRVLPVDGDPVTFATICAGAHWAAVARRHETVIAVTAFDIDAGELGLVMVADPHEMLFVARGVHSPQRGTRLRGWLAAPLCQRLPADDETPPRACLARAGS